MILYPGFFASEHAVQFARRRQVELDVRLARDLHAFAERINLAPTHRTYGDATEELVASIRRTADRIAAIAAAGQRL